MKLRELQISIYHLQGKKGIVKKQMNSARAVPDLRWVQKASVNQGLPQRSVFQ